MKPFPKKINKPILILRDNHGNEDSMVIRILYPNGRCEWDYFHTIHHDYRGVERPCNFDLSCFLYSGEKFSYSKTIKKMNDFDLKHGHNIYYWEYL